MIFGGSQYAPGDAPYDAAQALGRAIAARGWAVVNGGYAGTMLASAQGCAEAGGHTIGVGCRIFKGSVNTFVREEVQTDTIFARLQGLIELGDAYIVMPGSTGTLAELALTWELINKQMLPRRPILCWGEFWRPIVEVFSSDQMQDPRIHTLGVTEQRGALITFVHSVPAAMQALDVLDATPPLQSET